MLEIVFVIGAFISGGVFGLLAASLMAANKATDLQKEVEDLRALVLNSRRSRE